MYFPTETSYTEISPSGVGIRIICLGTLPAGRRRTSQPPKIELYDYSSPRFLTITGHRLEGTPTEPQERSEALGALHSELFPPVELKAPVAAPQPVSADDLEILELAREQCEKFQQLWSGDTTGYASHSEADLALAGYLAYYVGPDEDRVGELFAKSGLFREKWKRSDYRRATITAAMSREEVFNWEAYRSRIQEDEELRQIMETATPDALGFTGQIVDEWSTPKPETPRTDNDQFHDVAWWREHATPKPWLIRGWLKLGDTAILWGPTGSCKSFIALDMGLSVVYRMPFAGQPVRPGAVFYIYTEELGGALKRLDAWKVEHHIVEDPKNVFFTPFRYDLMTPEETGQQLIADVRKLAGHTPVAMIVVDTLSKCFAGDENSAEIANVEKTMAYVRDRLHCTIVTIHHTGHTATDRERGHSSLTVWPSWGRRKELHHVAHLVPSGAATE